MSGPRRGDFSVRAISDAPLDPADNLYRRVQEPIRLVRRSIRGLITQGGCPEVDISQMPGNRLREGGLASFEISGLQRIEVVSLVAPERVDDLPTFARCRGREEQRLE